MDESITEVLDPDFRFEHALAPYVERHLASAFSPAALARRAEQLGMEVGELAADLPGQFRRLLEMVEEGQFDLHLRTDELQPLVRRVERVGNRVAISILAAAVIDGLSELVAHNSRVPGGRKAVLSGAVAAAATVSAYTAWRRSPLARLTAGSPAEHG